MNAFKYFPADRRPADARICTPDYALTAAFLDHLRRAHPSWIHRHYGSPTRHFLFWLDRCRIPVATVDDSVVDRFLRHQCRCSRYSARQLRTSLYARRVRRFVRFLEDRGDIPVVRDIEVAAHIGEFVDSLNAVGHSPFVQRKYRAQAEHLACWLRLFRIQCCEVDKNTLDRFVQHDCHCPMRTKRGRPAEGRPLARRRRGARRFIGFLRERGVIPQTSLVLEPVEDSRLSAFRIWLGRDCGVTSETIQRYLGEASRWLASLGADPANFTAATIRGVVLDQGPLRSRASVRVTAAVLRSYLRFLATRGECRPELVHAVALAPRRRLATLPRYVSPAVIERIITSCDTATSLGLRDRAIILLLARLGLRAGDVWQLRLSDIDWANARVRLDGKSRRAAHLPLPQDAGDAVLAYLERARPAVQEDRVFLRIPAPFRPFGSSSEIAKVVAGAVARSGIDDIPTGAHIFRHSLATAMLRKGASLESIGTVLRHRSQSTTAIYAKVDVEMLMTVAQPWPGDVSC